MTSVHEKCLCQHFFGTLRCNNSVRTHQIIGFLDHFYQYSMNYIRSFLIELPKFLTDLSHMDSRALLAYILEAARTWHVQHEFSDCRCDIVCIWYNDNFITKYNSKNKK